MYPSCRVCMTGSGVLVNIFTKEQETFPSLEFMINECVDVKVTRTDKLPKHICKVCLSDVHAAFRFKRNYELTLKQLSKKSDVKEPESKETSDIFGEENNTEDVIAPEPKSTFGKKPKRAIAIKARRKVLISRKIKPKKKESKNKSERDRESYLNEESNNEESHADIKPDLTKISEKSESEKKELEREQLLSESPSVDEDDPKVKKKKIKMKPKKLYLCNLCDKVLKSSSHLSMHALVHSGEYPHECENCQAKFRYKWNLKRHVDKNVLCQGPYKKKRL